MHTSLTVKHAVNGKVSLRLALFADVTLAIMTSRNQWSIQSSDSGDFQDLLQGGFQNRKIGL